LLQLNKDSFLFVNAKYQPVAQLAGTKGVNRPLAR